MHIVNSKKLRDFADAVLRLEPSGWTSEVDPSQVNVLLGEMLDVWPWSIFSGCSDENDDEPSNVIRLPHLSAGGATSA